MGLAARVKGGFGEQVERGLPPCRAVFRGHDGGDDVDQLGARGGTHAIAVLEQGDRQGTFDRRPRCWSSSKCGDLGHGSWCKPCAASAFHWSSCSFHLSEYPYAHSSKDRAMSLVPLLASRA